MNPSYGPLFVPILAVIGALVHIARARHRTVDRALEIALLWGFGLVVGFGGLVITVSHVFFADATAAQIGFPAGNPFQFEVAMANFAFAVLGLTCLWIRGSFWTATALGFAVFYWGATVGHITQYVVAGNDAPYNVGPILVTDIGSPLVIGALLIALHVHRGRTATTTVSPEAGVAAGDEAAPRV